jgi:sugar/nucleoside kinase (ribokinase family)
LSAPLQVDALFVGPVYCDLIFAGLPHLPGSGEEVHADDFVVSPGGTATRCVAAARLGVRSGLISSVGDDLFGRELMRVLGAEPAIDLRGLRRVPAGRTPVTVAAVDPADRSFITYEQPSWSTTWSWSGPVPQAQICHVDAAADPPTWLTTMRSAGTMVVAGVGWDTTGVWDKHVLDRLGAVDVFCPNAVEAMSYTRTHDVATAAKALSERVRLTVVTKGVDGAVAIDSGTGDFAEVPALAGVAADPTGAGDVFVASFMVAALQEWSLLERLRFAVACAGLSVRRLGGALSAPTQTELGSWLESLPKGERADYAFLASWLDGGAGLGPGGKHG